MQKNKRGALCWGTPPSTIDMFGEKISAQTCCSRKIRMKNNNDIIIVKSHRKTVSCVTNLKKGMNELGLCIAMNESERYGLMTVECLLIFLPCM